jgi:hypothetical protein
LGIPTTSNIPSSFFKGHSKIILPTNAFGGYAKHIRRFCWVDDKLLVWQVFSVMAHAQKTKYLPLGIIPELKLELGALEMSRERYTPPQIIGKVWEAKVALAAVSLQSQNSSTGVDIDIIASSKTLSYI